MIVGRLFLDGKIKRLLIVAPASVCAVWPSEFKKFGDYATRVALLLGSRENRIAALKTLKAPAIPGLPEPLRVAVVNYESTWRLYDELAGFDADMIICDESQRIKSNTAQQSKAMHKLGDGARYKMILTGTPIQNDVRDIWSQYRFLNPDVFPMNFYAFLKRYVVLGGYGNHQYLGPRNLEEMTANAHSIAYRVTKGECLDLPEKIFEDREIILEDSARKLYRQIQKQSYAELENGEEITANHVLTRLLRLQQINGGFLSDDSGNTTPVSTAKLDALEDIIQQACIDEGQKVVVFARFRAEVAAIRERVESILHKHGKRHVAIWGDIPISQRGALIKDFQEDPDTMVFVGQIDSCAEGITLTAAHIMVYYSVTWNFAKYQQSQDRIHRVGQDRATLYINLTVPRTIDSKIMAALAEKRDLAKTVVDDWRQMLQEDI